LKPSLRRNKKPNGRKVDPSGEKNGPGTGMEKKSGKSGKSGITQIKVHNKVWWLLID